MFTRDRAFAIADSLASRGVPVSVNFGSGFTVVPKPNDPYRDTRGVPGYQVSVNPYCAELDTEIMRSIVAACDEHSFSVRFSVHVSENGSSYVQGTAQDS